MANLYMWNLKKRVLDRKNPFWGTSVFFRRIIKTPSFEAQMIDKGTGAMSDVILKQQTSDEMVDREPFTKVFSPFWHLNNKLNTFGRDVMPYVALHLKHDD